MKIGSFNYRITLKFNRHISSSAAEVVVKFGERSDNSVYKSRGFETSRDLTEKCLIKY